MCTPRRLAVLLLLSSSPALAQDMLFDFDGNAPSVQPTFIAYDCDGTVLNEAVRWEAASTSGNNYRRLGLNAGTRATTGDWPRALVRFAVASPNTRVRIRMPSDSTGLRQPLILTRSEPESRGFGWTPFFDGMDVFPRTCTFENGVQTLGSISVGTQGITEYVEVVTSRNATSLTLLTGGGQIEVRRGSATPPVGYDNVRGVSLVVGSNPAGSSGQPTGSNTNDAFYFSFDDISIMSLSRGTDCDNNGSADLFWRNPATGQSYQWLMGQTGLGVPRVNDFRPIGTFAGNWRIVGAGNIDNQGASDLVMQDTVTGDVRVWLFDAEGSLVARRWLGNPGATWRASAVADLNYDAMSDIVFRNSNGSNAVWTISSSGTLQSVVGLPYVGDTDWKIIGACDMNYDGQNDILWSRNGEVVVWLLGRDRSPSEINYLGFAPTDWQFLAAGDFDRDGVDNDLMWHNTTTGDIGMWDMNSQTIAAWVPLTNIGTTTAWQGGN